MMSCLRVVQTTDKRRTNMLTWEAEPSGPVLVSTFLKARLQGERGCGWVGGEVGVGKRFRMELMIK